MVVWWSLCHLGLNPKFLGVKWVHPPVSNVKKLAYRMGPPVDSVQLPNISGWILWFVVDMVDITILNGVYKPTYIWWGPQCRKIIIIWRYYPMVFTLWYCNKQGLSLRTLEYHMVNLSWPHSNFHRIGLVQPELIANELGIWQVASGFGLSQLSGYP